MCDQGVKLALWTLLDEIVDIIEQCGPIVFLVQYLLGEGVGSNVVVAYPFMEFLYHIDGLGWAHISEEWLEV